MEGGRRPEPPGPAPFPRAVSAAEFFAGELGALARGRAWATCAPVSDPAVVSIGVGGAAAPPYLARAAAEGVEVVRRHTGGTALLHLRGDLLWSLVLPRADPRVGRDFARGYGRLGRSVVRVLGDLGVRAAWVDPPATSAVYCTLGERGQVLEAGGAILGGAAQHLTANALLHHGTVSLRVDRARLVRIFGAELARPAARLGALADLGVTTDPAELAAQLAGALLEFARAPAAD